MNVAKRMKIAGAVFALLFFGVGLTHAATVELVPQFVETNAFVEWFVEGTDENGTDVDGTYSDLSGTYGEFNAAAGPGANGWDEWGWYSGAVSGSYQEIMGVPEANEFGLSFGGYQAFDVFDTGLYNGTYNYTLSAMLQGYYSLNILPENNDFRPINVDLYFYTDLWEQMHGGSPSYYVELFDPITLEVLFMVSEMEDLPPVLQSVQLIPGYTYDLYISMWMEQMNFGQVTNGYDEMGMFGENTADFLLSGIATENPVPLPGAFWLLGSGLIGLAGFVRRRQ